MTHMIRLLAAAVAMLFGTAVLMAIRGERVVAERAGHEWEWPGFAELLIILGLLATAIIFFAIILVLWLSIALRHLEWSWAIVMALTVIGLVAFIVGMTPPNWYLLSFLNHLVPNSAPSIFLGLPLLFVPLLAGTISPTIYSYVADRKRDPTGRDKPQRRIDMTLSAIVLVVVLLGYVAWLLRLGSEIAAVYADGPLLLAYLMPLCAALGIAVAGSTTLRAARSRQGIWSLGPGALIFVAIIAIITSIVRSELPIIAVALITSMVLLPLVVLISGIFSRPQRSGGGAVPASLPE